jgi:hypothetical protein
VDSGHIRALHSQHLVRDMVYVRWGPNSVARMAARRIYDKLDANLKSLGEQIILSKKEISERRRLLAHHVIPDALVKKFLEELGDGRPGLHPLEIAVFNHLKATTNTEVNIREASHG